MKVFLFKIVIAGLVLITASSCAKKDDFYLSEDEVKAFEAQINPVISNVVFIKDNDLYIYHTAGEPARKLTDSPDSVKFWPRISPDRSRVAYLNLRGYPVILSTITGDTVKSYPEYSGIKNYDWNPNHNPALSGGLYMLIGDSVTFSSQALDIPDIDLGAGGVWNKVAFDKYGNFFFFVTEQRAGGPTHRLYRWEKSTGKKQTMITDVPIAYPQFTDIFVSNNGDVTLTTTTNPNLPAINLVYFFPAGSLVYETKLKNELLNGIRYDGRTRQAVSYGYNPVKLYAEVYVKNFQPYPKAVNRSIDTNYISSMIQEMDWK